MNSSPASYPEWSAENVVRAIRRSLGLVALSYAPYFYELFDDDLANRIRHPAEIDFRPDRVARPVAIDAAGKRYFVPGSADDLLIYSSCVVAFIPRIGPRWEQLGVNADTGPPARDELLMGRLGERPWKHYWNAYHRRSGLIANSGHPWVLDTDIEACATRIDGRKLANDLSIWNGDPDAVRIFSGMHDAWHRFGFPGLPVSGTFCLLTRAYLLEVERGLQRRNRVFLRNIDDFRLFCSVPDEREEAIRAIADSLAARGLRLNRQKTRFYRFGDSGSKSRRWRLIVKGKFRYGAFRPVLVRMTSCRWLRPVCLFLLRTMARDQQAGRRATPA